MTWGQVNDEPEPDPDRANQPTDNYEFQSSGYVERTILQQLTSWNQETDEFSPSWSEGKPTWWFYKPVAELRDPSIRAGRHARREGFDPDPSLETTIRRALSRLQERGLIERSEHPEDSRQAMWNVTDDGVREAAMLSDAYATAQADLKKRYGVTRDDKSTIGSYAWDWFYLDRHTEGDKRDESEA